MKKRFYFLILFIIILIFGILFLNNKNNIKNNYKNGELNVLNWTSYIPDDVISDFEKEYNIKVNYGTYSSNEELLAKVSSSAPGTYDLIFPSDYMVDLLIQKNLLSPLEKNKIKNINNISEIFLNQIYDNENKYSLPFLLAYTVLIYDTEKINEEIKSYRDLLNEKYKNNIIILDDERIIIGAALLASGSDMNSTNNFDLDKALAYFDNLKPNLKAFDSDSPKTFLITKETEIGLVWNAEATLAKAENENLKIVFPREGFALSMDNYCLPVGARNSENAYKFIDFLLRDDIAERIVEEYPYVSPIETLVSKNETELKEILENGSYVKNVGAEIKTLDRLWAEFK